MKLLYKPTGQTINQFIEDYKNLHNIKKLCFCGRLDPMARGQILILENNECKVMESYLNKNKQYNFEIILSIKTDSDDPLGIIEEIDFPSKYFNYNKKYETICKIINKMNKNNYYQKFHEYSSKRVNGKPLWYYKKNNIDVKIPEKLVKILDINIGDIKHYEYVEWKDLIINQIKTIDSTKDFNQNKIINQWNNLNFDVLHSIPIQINVSSGFYVRQFVRDISNELNYPLLTYDINRTKIFLP